MAAIAASTTVAADARLRVMEAGDVLLPASEEVEGVRHRAVVELRTAAVDPRTVAAVAADMGGKTMLGSSPA